MPHEQIGQVCQRVPSSLAREPFDVHVKSILRHSTWPLLRAQHDKHAARTAFLKARSRSVEAFIGVLMPVGDHRVRFVGELSDLRPVCALEAPRIYLRDAAGGTRW